MKRPLTTGEIAQFCHVTHRAVLKWVASGKLKAYRTPGNHSRIETEDFVKFLSQYNMPVPEEFKPAAQKKILIVDDDKGMVDAIKRILLMENKYQIEISYEGFDAGRKFADLKPDLLILDIKIPGLDGYQVCSYIRNDLGNRNVKILAISGIFNEETIEKIKKLGADDYLLKPFDNKTLKEKITTLLAL